MQEFEGLVTKMKDLQAELKQRAEDIVRDGTKNYFADHGDIIHSFGWNQWIPGFNDGDPCTFTMGGLWLIAHEDIERVKEEEGEDVDDAIAEWKEDEGSDAFRWSKRKHCKTEGYRGDGKPNVHYDERFEAAYNDALALYNVMSTGNLAEEVFGSDASVLITPNGVDVDEYYCGY
jgi:hypothetical protein